MNTEYWNNGCWSRHLSAPNRMDICNALWVEKHQRLIDTLPKNSVLDLGCGIGQFTEYWLRNGFSVVSADISRIALDELRRRIPNANTLELDMGKTLPFQDGSFGVVFANLSIHYFESEATMQLSNEIWRMLKPDGLFMGSMNSSAAYEFIKDHIIPLEDNYYLSGERKVRLFDRQQFDLFFGKFAALLLEDIHTVRFQNPRDHWEFIFQKGN